MTRLNTDNLAAFLSVETPVADSPAPRAEQNTRPFDDFLQRAGQSPDNRAQDNRAPDNRAPDNRAQDTAPPSASEPVDAPSDSTEQDPRKPTESDLKSEEDRDPAESTADAGNATPESERAEAADRPSDDETDEPTSAPSEGSSDENGDGKDPPEVAVQVTQITSIGGGSETRDEAESGTEDAQSRDSSSAMKNRREDRPGEPDAANQASVEPEAGTEEEQPTNLRQQSGERNPSGPSEGAAKSGEGGDRVVAESQEQPKESALAQTPIDNPFDPALSPGRRTSSEESSRQSGRKGSTRVAAGDKEAAVEDRSAGPVAKLLVGQAEAAVAQQVNEAKTKLETQDQTAKPASTADLQANSPAPPKGWSPEGLRVSTAPATSDGTQTDQVDRVRFVQRVARAFEVLGEGNGSVRLRLKPPDLGGLRLEVSVRNGTMTAHIETETSAARTLLLDNLPALRERLAQQDIKIDRFDVDLADQQPDGSPQRSDDDRQPRDRADEQESPAREHQDPDPADRTSAGAVTRTGQGGRLDVVI